MLRVPSCSTSAYCATSPTSPGETTSVTTLRPVSARAAAIIFNADSPSPWNEYGEVRERVLICVRVAADDAEGAFFAARELGLQPDLLDPLHDRVDLGLGRCMRHNDDHGLNAPLM